MLCLTGVVSWGPKPCKNAWTTGTSLVEPCVLNPSKANQIYSPVRLTSVTLRTDAFLAFLRGFILLFGWNGVNLTIIIMDSDGNGLNRTFYFKTQTPRHSVEIVYRTVGSRPRKRTVKEHSHSIDYTGSFCRNVKYFQFLSSGQIFIVYRIKSWVMWHDIWFRNIFLGVIHSSFFILCFIC